MRAWQAEEFGDPEKVLALVDRELRELRDDEVEIEVHAAGVGLPDWLMVNGNYPAVRKPPIMPGQEVVGTVLRAGAEARVKPGQRVMTMSLFARRIGGFGEICFGQARWAMPVPDAMPDEQAAGFMVPFHTGWEGVVRRGQLAAGETMLVLGAAGSSGSAAVQIGKALGAKVIATVSSAEKAAFCRQLGADAVINYKEQAIDEGVLAATDGRGADVVYDPVGGSAYDAATRCVARDARIVLIGYSSGTWPKIDPLDVVLKSYSVVGGFMGALTIEEGEAHHRAMMELVEAGKLWVPVDRVYSFEEVPQAIARVGKNEAVGKVVVRVKR